MSKRQDIDELARDLCEIFRAAHPQSEQSYLEVASSFKGGLLDGYVYEQLADMAKNPSLRLVTPGSIKYFTTEKSDDVTHSNETPADRQARAEHARIERSQQRVNEEDSEPRNKEVAKYWIEKTRRELRGEPTDSDEY